eukprot:scaffold4094_cov201-Ochromonas_danica.AAC.3
MTILDGLVNLGYSLIPTFVLIKDVVANFFLTKYPGSRELSFFANSTNGCLASFLASGGAKQYWLFSLLTVIFGCYGGGMVAPIFLGQPSIPLINDLILFSVIIMWYLVYFTPVRDLLNYKVVRAIWYVPLALFRVNSSVNMVNLAMLHLKPSAYYPIPFFGPIFVGTAVGCMGLFLPFTKGYNSVANSTPWNMQGAFYTAFFYHTIVNDVNGPVGYGVRLVFGSHSRETMIVALGLIHAIHLQLQLWIHPDANLFAPFHKIFYVLTQVPSPVAPPAKTDVNVHVGWQPDARRRLEILINAIKWIAVVLVFCLHFSYCVVPSQLRAFDSQAKSSSLVYRVLGYQTNLQEQWEHVKLSGEDLLPGAKVFNLRLNELEYGDLKIRSLPVGQGLGSCQYLNPPTFFNGSSAVPYSSWLKRGCTPFLAVLERYSCPFDGSSDDEAVEGRRCGKPVRLLDSAVPTASPNLFANPAAAIKNLFDRRKNSQAVVSVEEPSHGSADKPSDYSEYAFIVYEGLSVNKFDLPNVVSHQKALSVIPIAQTTSSLFHNGRAVYFLVLNDGHGVLWTEDPAASKAGAPVLAYTYVDVVKLGRVQPGEEISALVIDDETGELRLTTNSVGKGAEL